METRWTGGQWAPSTSDNTTDSGSGDSTTTSGSSDSSTGLGFMESGYSQNAWVGPKENLAYGWTPHEQQADTTPQSGTISRTDQNKGQSAGRVAFDWAGRFASFAAGGASGIFSTVSSMLGFGGAASGAAAGATAAGTAAAGEAVGSAAGAGLGAISTLGAGLFFGGMVFGPIIGRILEGAFEKADPHGRMRGTPAGDRSNYEDGVVYTSKLGNIGMSDSATKYVNASQLNQLMEAYVQMDNAVYDFLDDTARKAITEGFTWDADMTDVSQFRGRYSQMINYAAKAGSDGAKNAQKTIGDASKDYEIAVSAIRSHINQDLAEKKSKLASSEGADKAAYDEAMQQAQMTDGGGLIQSGIATSRMISGSRETQAARRDVPSDNTFNLSTGDTTQGNVDAMASVAEAAYSDYVDAGGLMDQDMFASAFKDEITRAASGEKALGSDRTSSINAFEKRTGVDLGSTGSMSMTDEEYFAFMIAGLAGFSYEDIVSGKAANGTANLEQVKAGYQGFTGGTQQDATSSSSSDSYANSRYGLNGGNGWGGG